MQNAYKDIADVHFQPVGLYYLPVTNNRLAPKYCLGELIIADPQKPIQSSDYVVFWINAKHYVIAKANDNWAEPKSKWVFWKKSGASKKPYLAAHKIVGCIEITPNNYRFSD
ncbi:MAG: hypothetical protein EYC62_06990 [Alphaproteobacteria bacterium]|nr:MAG: hypothetical protein EYC62_06990 [Alphaproteobacteria bacterium]